MGITLLGAVNVEGVEPKDMPTWYEMSLIAGPVVIDTAAITVGGLDAEVQELADRMDSDVWQARTVTDDGTLLIVVSLTSDDDASAALTAMVEGESHRCDARRFD
ncbi:MAG: hypothetical protein WBG76_03305 [Ornithinimicrobium sp.]